MTDFGFINLTFTVIFNLYDVRLEKVIATIIFIYIIWFRLRLLSFGKPFWFLKLQIPK